MKRGEQFLHASSDHPCVASVKQDRAHDHKVEPRERFLRCSLALQDLGDGSPFRLGTLDITKTRRKVMVVLREGPSQIAKLRHPF